MSGFPEYEPVPICDSGEITLDMNLDHAGERPNSFTFLNGDGSVAQSCTSEALPGHSKCESTRWHGNSKNAGRWGYNKISGESSASNGYYLYSPQKTVSVSVTFNSKIGRKLVVTAGPEDGCEFNSDECMCESDSWAILHLPIASSDVTLFEGSGKEGSSSSYEYGGYYFHNKKPDRRNYNHVHAAPALSSPNWNTCDKATTTTIVPSAEEDGGYRPTFKKKVYISSHRQVNNLNGGNPNWCDGEGHIMSWEIVVDGSGTVLGVNPIFALNIML